MPAIQSSEFNAAFRSLHKANSILCMVILLCLVLQIGGFCAVEFGKVLQCQPVQKCDETPATQASVPTTAPTTAPASPAVAEPVTVDIKACTAQKQRACNWQYGLNWTLAATKCVALVAVVLLFVLQTVTGHLSLVGPGVRGIKQIISSVCWTVILLVMLVPWQQVLRPSHITGATFNLGDIINYQASVTGGGLGVLIPYYARFLAYPGIALLVWVMVTVKFAIGYHRLTGPQAAMTARPAQCVEVK